MSTFALHQSCASTRDSLPVWSLSNSHFKGAIIANKLVLCLMIDMTSYLYLHNPETLAIKSQLTKESSSLDDYF